MIVGKINKRYATYSNAGGIKEVISGESLTYYETLTQIFNYYGNKDYVKGNLKLKHYGFDDRIGKDVYMLTGDHSNHKDQFTCFVIEIMDEEDKICLN